MKTELNRSARFVMLGFAIGLLVAGMSSCGGKKCDRSNCATGCCSATGVCELGSSSNACGSGGNACTQCLVSQLCQFGSCIGSGGGGQGGGSQGGGTGGGATGGGTGGGATGGGTGGGAMGGGAGGGAMGGGAGGGAMGGGAGGGGGTACRQIATFAGAASLGGYAANSNGADFALGRALASATPPTDMLQMEVYVPTGSTWPVPAANVNLASAGTYNTCTHCVWFGESCTAPDQGNPGCSKTYLARSGTANYAAATQNDQTGVFQASISNVRFDEWDLAGDTASGTGCVIITTGGVNASWP